ncbi:MAG: flavodoxin [Deltaproteobacteria bacterium]|jgi:flavodoxin|nr:flavodoxin [Deltaproteobacteria bacterium]
MISSSGLVRAPVFAAGESGGGSGPVVAPPKILVVYYSFGGSTALLAGKIAALAKADLRELMPAVPYPQEEGKLSELAKEEGRAGILPVLATGAPDPAGYGVVLVGSPVWWFGLAGPVRSWLAASNFSGKAVALFVTHGGGGPSKCMADLRKYSGAAVVEPSVFSAVGDGSGGLGVLDDGRLVSWLKGIAASGGGQASPLGL